MLPINIVLIFALMLGLLGGLMLWIDNQNDKKQARLKNK